MFTVHLTVIVVAVVFIVGVGVVIVVAVVFIVGVGVVFVVVVVVAAAVAVVVFSCSNIQVVSGSVAVEHTAKDASIAIDDDKHGNNEGNNKETDVEDEYGQWVSLPITVRSILCGAGPRHHEDGNTQQTRC